MKPQHSLRPEQFPPSQARSERKSPVSRCQDTTQVEAQRRMWLILRDETPDQHFANAENYRLRERRQPTRRAKAQPRLQVEWREAVLLVVQSCRVTNPSTSQL